MARILLLEDDLVDQMAIQRMIRKHSEHQLDMASSIQEAIDLLKIASFDIAIADFHLNDGTAFELLSQIDMPCIVVSGIDQKEIYTQLIESGAYQVLHKDSQLNYIQYLPKLINRILDDSHHLDIEENALSDTAGPTGHSAAPYNLNQLAHSFDYQPGIITEMIDTFLLQTPENLSHLRQAAQQEDTSQISYVAHRIKSGYKLMGMEQQEHLAEKIERHAKASQINLQQLVTWINQLIRDTESIYPLLQEAKNSFKS
ncbi:MAG: Hpt domain-containing protein [Bacteroidota bacterium]